MRALRLGLILLLAVAPSFARAESNCTDTTDNDGDTFIDCLDSGCVTHLACGAADFDADTVQNSTDNCALIANTTQTNTDAAADGGDACDTDDDNDLDLDVADNCPLVANADQLNTDAAADGGDACDTDDDNDGDPDTTDCNDTNAAVFTGAAESCDAIDSDCDASLVDGFANFDSDTQPDCTDTDDDNDSDPDTTDCNDTNSAVYTGAAESCDSIDSDCDGSLVDGFTNFDSDTEPDCVDSDDDNDLDPDSTDCNDNNNAVHAAATESCDAIDSDCDGSLVDTFTNTDGDTEPNCTDLNDDNDPELDSVDCNDTDDTVYTTATDDASAVLVDNDCDGVFDEAAVLAGDIVINEVIISPTTNNNREWVELRNTTARTIRLRGWTWSDTGSTAITFAEDLDVPAGGYRVLCRSVSNATNVGVTCLNTGNLAFDLTTADTLTVTANGLSSALVVDTVVVGTGFPSASGRSSHFAPAFTTGRHTANDTAGNWCLSYTQWSTGDQGTPGAANTSCAVAQQDLDNDSWCTGGYDANNDQDCDEGGDELNGPAGCLGCNDCDDADNTLAPLLTESCDSEDTDCDGSLVDGFTNTDSDAQPDCVDTDDDNDGDLDTADNCPLIANGDQLNSDGAADGGNACDTDDDNDGDLDTADNCPVVSNANQANFDADTEGDLCDTDDDNDTDPDTTDCNDADNTIYTGAAETCDNVDSDCDGSLVDTFANTDGDTLPDCIDSDADGDGSAPPADCDDSNSARFPGATESCDNIDSDCDGSIVDTFTDTDSDLSPDCVDPDDDGDTDPDTSDCNDTNAAVFTGAAELCDNVDSDCDLSLVDGFANFDSDTQPDCVDSDDDNDADPDASDCAPFDNTRHSAAAESCDSIDSNCNGSLIDAFSNADGDTEPDCIDLNDDNDPDPDATDCNDTNPAAYTGNPSEFCDAIDSDCDGDLVDGFANFDADTEPDCADFDDDNDGDLDVTDCADLDPAFHAGAVEACDLIDQDCDGSLIDGFANFDADAQPDCADTDDDNDGDPDSTDCNSANNSIYTNAPETCDNVDSNCNGSLIDTFANSDTDAQPNCIDTDDDNDTSPDTLDCDDNNSAIRPGAPELCDTTDSDCDGSLVDSYADSDGDGLPDCIDNDVDGDGYAFPADCQPNNSAIFPGAAESCDNIDSDCDSSLVDTFTNSDTDAEPDCIDLDDDDDSYPDLHPSTPDCGPTDPAIHPGAPDPCDLIDQDCDGNVVESYADLDGDLQPDCADLDDDADSDPDASDCAALDATRFTGAPEGCDTIDSDCDGSLVDGFANADSDLNPDCADADDDNDGDLDASDCAPLDPTIRNGATEICDSIDSDCDGSIVDSFLNADSDLEPDCVDLDDDNDAVPDASDNCDLVANGGNQSDFDGDGEGDACDLNDDNDPDADSIDCDDTNASRHSLAVDLCNTIDEDCDGNLVEGFANADGDATPDCADNDVDGDGSTTDVDCNDLDPAISPLNPEVCSNGIDENCNGTVDGADPTTDSDSDSYSLCADDCDDTDAAIHPGATELCTGPDEDCDGLLGAFDPDTDADGDAQSLCSGDCADDNATIWHGAVELCDGLDGNCDGAVPPDEFDPDGDGSKQCEGDCEPGNAAIFPGAVEVCDGVDDDCDATVDDGFDGDNDGFTSCALPVPDCNDTSDYVYPGAIEICDGTDSDCDAATTADEGDEDADLWVPCSVFIDVGAGFLGGEDCDDLDLSVFPGATEDAICDGLDNDCDASNDEPFDGDHDGYFAATDCAGAYPVDQLDCDDDNDNVHPNQLEFCEFVGDQLDTDCDGHVDTTAGAGEPDPASNRITVFEDRDLDLFGSGQQIFVCVPPDQEGCGVEGAPPCRSLTTGDCNDNNAAQHPGAPEICNGIDEDCDFVEDEPEDLLIEGGGSGCVDLYRDLDGDGIGDWGNSQCLCLPSGTSVQHQGTTFVNQGGDCDDQNDETYPALSIGSSTAPAAEEQLDGHDNDCDGRIAAVELDCDDDGAFASTPTLQTAVMTAPALGLRSCTELAEPPALSCWDQPELTLVCDAPTGLWQVRYGESEDHFGGRFVGGRREYLAERACAGAADCDDTCPERCPDRAEVCDGLDNDCTAERFDRGDGLPGAMGGAGVIAGTVSDQEVDVDGDGLLPCDGFVGDGHQFQVTRRACVDAVIDPLALSDCNAMCSLSSLIAEERCDGVLNVCGAPTEPGDGDRDGHRSCGAFSLGGEGDEGALPEDVFVVAWKAPAIREPGEPSMVPLLLPRTYKCAPEDEDCLEQPVDCDQGLFNELARLLGEGTAGVAALRGVLERETSAGLLDGICANPQTDHARSGTCGVIRITLDSRVDAAALDGVDSLVAARAEVESAFTATCEEHPEQYASRTVWTADRILDARESVVEFECVRLFEGVASCDDVEPYTRLRDGWETLVDLSPEAGDPRWRMTIGRFSPVGVTSGTIAACWGDPWEDDLSTIVGGDCLDEGSGDESNRDLPEGPWDVMGAYLLDTVDGVDALPSCEACLDGVDNNCDGLMDCDDPSCAPCFVGQGGGCGAEGSPCKGPGCKASLSARGTLDGLWLGLALPLILRRARRSRTAAA